MVKVSVYKASAVVAITAQQLLEDIIIVSVVTIQANWDNVNVILPVGL